jgi:hypothetical protein
MADTCEITPKTLRVPTYIHDYIQSLMKRYEGTSVTLEEILQMIIIVGCDRLLE